MNGQPFWQLQAYPGFQINVYIGSVHTFESNVAYGAFSEDLCVFESYSMNILRPIKMEFVRM